MKLRYLLRDSYLLIRSVFIKLFIYSRLAIVTDPDSIRSILVIRIDRIGDVIISLPAIKALKAIFPSAKITVLTQPSIAALISSEPYISEVIPFSDGISTLSRIRDMKFDIVVDLLMDYSIKTAVIAYFSKAAVKAGFDISGRGKFFNVAVKPDTKEKHMSEHTLDLVRYVARCYKAEYRGNWDPEPHLTVSKNATIAAEGILSSNGISKGQRLISVHPGGYFPSQRWMPRAFTGLIDSIAEKYNVKIIVIGSSSEEKLIDEIVSHAGCKPVRITGYSLDVIAAVIKASDLLICNNSGPLHIAAAVGTSTVSTLGPTVPHLWYPIGENHAVIRNAIPCSPCNKGVCDRHECMEGITVDEMENAVTHMLEKTIQRKKGAAPRNAPKYPADKILVINLGGIGDAILSTPALRNLKNMYPGAKFYFLGIKRVNEFVKNLEYIDEVLDFTLGLSPSAMISNINVLAYLKRQKIDIAINMRTLVSWAGALKIKMLITSIGPGITIGRDTEGIGGYFDIRIPESLTGDKSELEYDMDVVSALGGDVVDKEPDIVISEDSIKKVEAMLGDYGIAGSDTLIGIHPGGKPSHRWSAEKFAEVIEAINDSFSARFIVTGDEEDRSSADLIKKSSKVGVIDVTGKLSLGELAALIKRCSLFICNDTAAMHIAAALKVPLIAIFGPGYLKRFDPRNIYKDAIVIHQETSCAPCDLKMCDKMECLNNIGPSVVIEAAFGIIMKNNMPVRD